MSKGPRRAKKGQATFLRQVCAAGLAEVDPKDLEALGH